MVFLPRLAARETAGLGVDARGYTTVRACSLPGTRDAAQVLEAQMGETMGGLLFAMGMIVFYAWTCEGGEVDNGLSLSLSSTMHAGEKEDVPLLGTVSGVIVFTSTSTAFWCGRFWILRCPAVELCALREAAAWRVGGSNDTLGWRMHSLPTVVLYDAFFF